MAEKKLTPMMAQFQRLKAENPKTLLLFRCGDFYETYLDDAVTASRVLGITLTKRNNGASEGDAMAGFPYHALDTYMPRLVEKGIRVAVCDQLEDPKLAKTLVRRGVTELVTPGVVLQDTVLRGKENNYLCAVHTGRQGVGLAFLDISTGEFTVSEGSWPEAVKLVGDLDPKEVLYSRERAAAFFQHFPSRLCTFALDDWVFQEDTARRLVCEHFGVRTLKGFGVEHMRAAVVAAGAVLHYLTVTHHTRLGHIQSLRPLDPGRYVRLDPFTLRSLEVLRPMTGEGASLLSVVDVTRTAMGGRLLRRWLTFPLRDVRQIRRRQDIVEYTRQTAPFRSILEDQLSRIADMERLAAKVETGRVNPRELLSLSEALDAVARLRYTCEHADNGALVALAEGLDPSAETRERIVATLSPAPPLLVSKGGVIRDGVCPELDELRALHRDSTAFLLRIQQREAGRTGIQSLKVGYNNVFGYYLEVRNTYKSRVPQEWTRKQTLAQAERYITPELKEYEQKILSAEDRIQALEARLYSELVTFVSTATARVQRAGAAVAELDCLLSFALVATARGYVRPEVDESDTLDIAQGRHAVIEAHMCDGEEYVPNDVSLSCGGRQVMIITGPNMAGKSALLRQTALIVLLAQAGCPVPAHRARVGVVDKIYTRVGASDNIAAGESTFMVEMTEAADIVNNATRRSLVLFDELGRGTSTYDGLSIAWAVVEHLHEKIGCRTLFATHYHELNALAARLPRVEAWNVAVEEQEGKVLFLRKLMEGGARQSFGIHVAEMAGMPRGLVKRAAEVLRGLESETTVPPTAPPSPPKGGMSPAQEDVVSAHIPPLGGLGGAVATLFDGETISEIRDMLLSTDIDTLTPLQALNRLSEIRALVAR